MVDYDYDDADWAWKDEELKEEKSKEKEESVNKDAEEEPPMDDLFSDFLEELREAGKGAECSCGADIIGFKNHSDFCPKYKVKPFQT